MANVPLSPDKPQALRARLRRLLAFLIESSKECSARQKMVEDFYK